MEKWCEHFEKPYSEINIEKWAYVGGQQLVLVKGWNFCPICGAPRPKEKSLDEKLSENASLFGFVYDKAQLDERVSKVVSICNDHFKSKQ